LRCPKYGGVKPYFDRCAILASLHLPPAALGDEARHARASDKFCLTKKKQSPNGDCFFLAGAEGLEPSARGFGAKSTLSVKPRVKIQSPHKIRIKTALSGFESAVRFCLYNFC